MQKNNKQLSLDYLKHIDNKSFHFKVITTFFILLQLIFLWRFGIETKFEAAKYINQATHLIENGTYTSSNFIFYSTQIWLIAFCLKMNIGFGFIVLIQILLNAISLWLFYCLIEHFVNRKSIAFLFTMALLLMVYYHIYNVYLFSESLYFSFSIIYTFYLLRLRTFSFTSFLFILFFLLILLLTRPHGLFFIPATFTYLLLRFLNKKTSYAIILIATICFFIAFYFLLNASLKSGGEYDFLIPFEYGHIICGVPTFVDKYNINTPVNPNSIEGLWFVIKNHSLIFLELASKRLFAFFFVIRSYYSIAHNLFIGIYFLLIYITGVIGLNKVIKSKAPYIIFLLVPVFFTALTVALSCDEWHNRFIFSILPFLLIFSAFSFSKSSTEKSMLEDKS